QAPDELSLDQAIARALQHHPMIQTQKARVDAFAAEITQARSARFPQITAAAQGKLGLSGASGGLGLQGLVASPFYKNVAASAHVYQNFFDFGRTDHATNAARFLKEAAEKDVEASAATVKLEVQKAYLQALQNQSLIRLDERIIDERQLQYKKADALFQSGLRSKLDARLSEYQLRQSEAKLAEHREALRRSFAELNRAMGLNSSQQYALKELLIEPQPPGETEGLVAQALKNRPEVRSLELQLQATREQLALAKSERYPKLAGIWSGGFARFSEYTLSQLMVAALGVGFPIFTGKRLEAIIREKEDSVKMLESELENLKQAVRLEVSQAVSDMARYQTILPVLKQQIEVAQESLDLANARHQAALASYLDVLTAETAHTEAQIRHTETLYDYGAAEFRLKFGLGTGTN
ncbi:MAG TPA: TolC family protein, partial [Acidobacteriota bacterium]